MIMIKVGVSACVMGDAVRYDGGHKKSAYTVNYLADEFIMVPVCPEVGMGMPVPRPAIRVIEVEDQHRLVDSKVSSIDYTDDLNQFYVKKADSFADLDGYIFAAKSPTCGVERIKVFDKDGNLIHRKGMGLFARKIKENYPLLPVEEDGRLNDHGLRESFVTKVYAHARFRRDVFASLSMKSLINFHSTHKFLVLAYSTDTYRQLGRIVAEAHDKPLEEIAFQYISMMLEAFSKPTNRKKHTNVLMHLQGYFKNKLDKVDKQELSEQIEQYRLGEVPLLAPLTLLKHHLKHFPNEYVARQVYFSPYPASLQLRA